MEITLKSNISNKKDLKRKITFFLLTFELILFISKIIFKFEDYHAYKNIYLGDYSTFIENNFCIGYAYLNLVLSKLFSQTIAGYQLFRITIIILNLILIDNTVNNIAYINKKENNQTNFKYSLIYTFLYSIIIYFDCLLTIRSGLGSSLSIYFSSVILKSSLYNLSFKNILQIISSFILIYSIHSLVSYLYVASIFLFILYLNIYRYFNGSRLINIYNRFIIVNIINYISLFSILFFHFSFRDNVHIGSINNLRLIPYSTSLFIIYIIVDYILSNRIRKYGTTFILTPILFISSFYSIYSLFYLVNSNFLFGSTDAIIRIVSFFNFAIASYFFFLEEGLLRKAIFIYLSIHAVFILRLLF